MQNVLAPDVIAKKPDWPSLGELALHTRQAIEGNSQIQADAARRSACWMASLREAWAAGYTGSLTAWKHFVEQGGDGSRSSRAAD